MKKITRIFSLALAVAVCVTAFANTVVFAAGYTEGEMGSPEFFYSEMLPTSVKQTCVEVNMHTNGGSVYYYGNSRSPETWADEPVFKSGYTYKQKGGGGNAYSGNYLQFEFDAKSLTGGDYIIQTNDIIYFSFYYKNASAFKFLDSDTEDTAGTNDPPISVKLGGNNQYGYRMFNLNTPDSNAGNKRATEQLYPKADGMWHKAELGVMFSDDLTDSQKNNIKLQDKIRITVDFYNLKNAFQIQFSDFSVGLMHFDSSKTSADSITYVRGLEYLCRTIEAKTADTKAIASDGFITNMTTDTETGEKVYDYTVTSTSETPVIEATDKSNGSFKTFLATESKKNADGTISANVYSPAYDKTSEAESKASYIQFSDLDSTTNPGSTGVGCTKRSSDTVNGSYIETYTLNTQSEYRIFKPQEVVHNVNNTNARNNTVVYTYYKRSEEPIVDDNFSEAYSMQLIKRNEGDGDTVTESIDTNYLQFIFNTNKYAEQYDILMYSFYIKVDSESGMTGDFTPKVTVVGNASGSENIERTVFDSSNKYLALSKDYNTITSYTPNKGWYKVVKLVNAGSSVNQWLRIGAAADGTTDYKISITEPRVSIIKLPSKKMPPCEKTYNNSRTTIGFDYAMKNDITGIYVGEKYFPVSSGDTEINVSGAYGNESNISIVSPYGDMPYTVAKNEDGTCTIKVKSIAYNPFLTNLQRYLRPTTGYTYSNGDTTTLFDYEKHLVNNVTAVTTGNKDGTVDSFSTARLLTITGLSSGMKVTFSKDGGNALGNLTPATGGSDYSFKIEYSDFDDGINIILAAYNRTTNELLKTGIGTFSGGTGTANLQKVVNEDGNVMFKVFVWDLINGLIPFTNSVEIDENTIDMPEIIYAH